MFNDKFLINKIKQLKKIKNDLPMKTQQRRDINAEIRKLKKQLNMNYDITPEKMKLIDKIYKCKPYLKKLKIELLKFSIEELKFHYKKIRKKLV